MKENLYNLRLTSFVALSGILAHAFTANIGRAILAFYDITFHRIT
jgi:hypothetical protein